MHLFTRSLSDGKKGLSVPMWLGAALLCCAWALAQEAEPVVAPRPGRAPSARAEVVVTRGETVLLSHKSGKKIRQALATRPSLVRLKPADPKEPHAVQVEALAPGETTVQLTDEAGETQSFTLLILPNREDEAARLLEIQQQLAKQFPHASLSISLAPSGRIVVTGFVEAKEEVEPILTFLRGLTETRSADSVINGIRVAGVMQVQLEVCVARVFRSELRQLGFNFLNADQQNFIGSTVGRLINARNLTIAPRGGVGTFSGNDLIPAETNIFFGITDRTSAFLGFLRALRDENLAKVLAQPTLVAYSGRPASFLVGGEVPVPQASATGTPSITYKEFGTRLNFLPIVLGNGKIRLEVEPEVSNPREVILQGIGTTFRFDTDRVRTTVELENGQTLVIGGLLQNEVSGTTRKVPVLGDLPFAGALFRSVQYEERETELIVLVTVRLVDPLDASQRPLTLPGHETRTPSDFELFLEGILEAPRGPRTPFACGHYQPAFWQAAGVCGPECEIPDICAPCSAAKPDGSAPRPGTPAVPQKHAHTEVQTTRTSPERIVQPPMLKQEERPNESGRSVAPATEQPTEQPMQADAERGDVSSGAGVAPASLDRQPSDADTQSASPCEGTHQEKSAQVPRMDSRTESKSQLESSQPAQVPDKDAQDSSAHPEGDRMP